MSKKYIKYLSSFIIGTGLLFSLNFVVKATQNEAAPEKVKITPADKEKVVVKIGDKTITAGELENKLNNIVPFVRKRYVSDEGKREYLEQLVNQEVLAMEAKAQDFDEKESVKNAVRTTMIYRQKKLAVNNRIKKENITEKEIKEYYDKHINEYQRPERRRVNILVVKDKKKAEKLKKEITAKKLNLRTFHKMVKKHSIDEKSKKRAGMLQFFDKDSKKIEKSIIAQAFNMKKTGEIAGPVKTSKGFTLIRLSGISPTVNKSLEEVNDLIVERILRKKRSKELKNYLEELRKNAEIKIIEENLDLVKINNNHKPLGGKNFHSPGKQSRHKQRRVPPSLRKKLKNKMTGKTKK
ncbi:MAG: peptidylprolyl isomerase [Myxococcota bacterium]